MTPRLAIASDRAALAPLLAELARLHAQDERGAGAAAALLTAPEGRSGPFCLVAPEDDRLLGFAILCGAFPAMDFAWGLVLTDLFVAAPSRRRGIGRALLRAACSFARENGYVRIDNNVRCDETLPAAFYAALGIPPAERRVYRLQGALLATVAEGNWPGRALR